MIQYTEFFTPEKRTVKKSFMGIYLNVVDHITGTDYPYVFVKTGNESNPSQ
jgi:hypothetical protein